MADISTGRNPRKETFWRRMLVRQKESGKNIRAFCQRHELKECTFHWWRRTLAQRDAAQSQAPPPASLPIPKFTPVQVTPDPLPGAHSPHLPVAGGSELEIVLAGERRLRLRGPVDRELLADVVRVLEALPVREPSPC